MSAHYFVTGATGVVGSRLLPELAATGAERIWVLLRGASDEEVAQRLRQLVSSVGTPETTEILAERLVPVRGDMAQRRWGIDAQQYAAICGSCSHIIHSAGVVRMNLPIEEARQYAVEAAKNVIEMAAESGRAGTLRKVEYVSTVGVAGRGWRQLPEEWIGDQGPFHNTYEQAKAEAELLVQRAVEEGHPITTIRPTMVVGDSETGAVRQFQVFYYLCDLLSGRRTFGILPELGQARVDTVPCDYVARLITWSAQTSSTAGRILHAGSGRRAIHLSVLRRLCVERMGTQWLPHLELPHPLFALLLQFVLGVTTGSLRKRLNTLTIFLDYLGDNQVFDTHRTEELLTQHRGPTLPEPEDYLPTVLSHYVERQRSRRRPGLR